MVRSLIDVCLVPKRPPQYTPFWKARRLVSASLEMPGPSRRRPTARCGTVRYFGRIVGSPPGLPGGGITGVLPVFGAGACISGSTPGGGQSTPSERANLSLSSSARCPVVVPSVAAVPDCGARCIEAQSAARSGDGGAVWAGGVVGAGGACAPATLEAAINTHERRSARFKLMSGKQPVGAEVP